MIDRQSGELLYSSAGQVVITSSWQTIGGTAYPEPQSFAAVADRSLESHQQIWHVLVDVDNGQVRQVNQQADRVISDSVNPDIVQYGGEHVYAKCDCSECRLCCQVD